MSVPVTFGQPDNLPQGYCWTTPQQYLTDIAALLVASVSGLGVVISASAPAPADQDKLWARLVGGYLEGVYSYNGGWFRTHPIPASSSERKIWRGNLTDLTTYDGGDGAGPITPVTGAMWERDTDFGADDGSSVFKMPVGVGLNPTAYDGNAATSIGLSGTGGEEKHKLLIDKIPPHTHIVNQGKVGHDVADTPIFQATNTDGQGATVTGDIFGGTNPNNHHQNMPPYLGVYFIKRTARVYIQAT